jgi:hypothetical protein
MSEDNDNIFGLYKQIIEEGKVALYAFHTGKDSRIPDRDEISRNLALLKPLGTADDKYAKRIEIDTKFEAEDSKDLFSDIVSKKIGISNTKGKNKKDKVGDLAAFLRRLFVNEGVENGVSVLKKLLPDGVFKIDESDSYNAIDMAKAGLLDVFSGDEEAFKALSKVMGIIIRETPNVAQTNIGPGEIFFALFSNAKLAGAGEGAKSGDLELSLESGKKLAFELKSKGARFGGDRSIIHGAEKLKKILGSAVDAQSPKLDKLVAILIDLKAKLDSYKSGEDVKDFCNYYESQIKSIHIKVQVEIKGITNFVRTLPSGTYPNGMNTLVSSSTGKVATSRSNLITLSEYLSNEIHEKTLALTKNIQDAKNQGFASNLVDNTYTAFKALGIKGSALSEDLVLDVLLASNSYEEENLKGKSGNFDIRNNLRTYLFSGNSPQSIIDIPYEEIEKLIGAMHLVSYANDKEFDKLLMLGLESKNVKIFDSPRTLQLALKIMEDPDVRINPIVDKAKGATIIGTSAMIYID